jgi:hypothetical protein
VAAHQALAAVDATLRIDANGSPVTIAPACWWVCFVPGLRPQWWHPLAHARHKHVFALRPLADGSWLLVEPWWTRLMVNVLAPEQAMQFLRWAAAGDVLAVREAIPGRGSQLRGWSNCSVLVAFLLGRNYLSWTPNGLYRRLAREPGVVRIDVRRLVREQAIMPEAEAAAARHRGAALDEALAELGAGAVAVMVSSTGVALYATAAGTFGSPMDACWAFGLGRVAGRIRDALEQARRDGDIELDDCGTATWRLMAMLRGNLCLEVCLGVREAPGEDEVRAHVASAVGLFLRGARAR